MVQYFTYRSPVVLSIYRLSLLPLMALQNLLLLPSGMRVGIQQADLDTRAEYSLM